MNKKTSIIDAQKNLENLIREIKFHNELYYSLNESQISDNEYDTIKQKANEIAIKFPELKKLLDKSIGVGFAPSTKFQKIKHKKPMLSLSNAFSKSDIEDFLSKIQRFFPNKKNIDFNLELKIDGLSFSAIYEDGVYKKGISRGDGAFGEDITENIAQILDFPLILNKKINIEVRGEAYMPLSTFEDLCKSNNSSQTIATPRNIASGTLRNLDSGVVKSRKLKYFVYSLDYPSISQQSEALKFAEDIGFCTNKYSSIANSIDDIEDKYIEMIKIKNHLDYGVDGMVIKINELTLQQRMGATNKAPRWAIAYKFPSPKKETQVLDIVTQIGRTGAIIPVAILKPIEICGCKISRATLHNFFDLTNKDIRINDFVIVERAGDVIPHVISVVKEKRSNDVKKYNIPQICPCCKSALIIKDKVLKCPASMHCEEQKIRRIEFFASKDAFDISGLSKKTIRKLLDEKIIYNISSIFDIEKNFGLEVISNINGMGKKSAQNLLKEIEFSKKSSMAKIIKSLGIENVGHGAAKLIANNIKNPEDLTNIEKIKKLEIIAGIGSKTIDSLINFIEKKENKMEINMLLSKIQIEKIEEDKINSYITNKKIVFTGTLNSMSRQEAKTIAEKHGAIVSSSISKNTDLVVIGKNSGSKERDAMNLSIETINEEKWLSLINADNIFY